MTRRHRPTLPAVCMLLAKSVAAVLTVAVMAGCSRSGNGASASDDADMQPLACRVDSTNIQLRDGSEFVVPAQIPEVPNGQLTYSSEQPVIDALYALEADELRTYAYTDATPYSALLLPTDPATIGALESAVVDGRLAIPGEGELCYWPVASQHLEWLMGAAEVMRAGGGTLSRKQLRALAETELADAEQVKLDPTLGVVRGLPSYLLAPAAEFPAWMGDAERFMALGATSCMAYRSAAAILGQEHTESLSRSIVKHFWVPALGGFSPIVYGSADGVYRLQMQTVDNVAGAISVLTGVASHPMTEAIFSAARITPAGVTLTYPTFDRAQGFLPTAHALWMAAAARSNNRAAYESAASHVIADAATAHSNGEKSITSLIVRGLLGVRFNETSLQFAPFVPRWLPGEKSITNFRYGDATFDVTLNGTGNYITTFTIDGQLAQPVIPAGSLRGRHSIAITLAGDPADADPRLSLADTLSLPAAPEVKWTKPATDDGTAHLVNPTHFEAELTLYVDGTNLMDLPEGAFSVPTDPDAFTSAQVATTINGIWSTFSCEPHVTFPHTSLARINLLRLARTGTRIIQNKRVAARFVESGRWKNREIAFEHSVAREADYIIDVHYLNGLGIVNPTRRFGLRSVSVDREDVGTIFFPQLPPSHWNSENDWQLSTGFSTAVQVHLSRGPHRIAISHLEPQTHPLDPDLNTILMDYVRIIMK